MENHRASSKLIMHLQGGFYEDRPVDWISIAGLPVGSGSGGVGGWAAEHLGWQVTARVGDSRLNASCARVTHIS